MHFLKTLGLLILLGIFLAVGGIWYGVQQLQPVNPQQPQTQTFVVSKGQSITKIAQQLVDAKLIRHPLAFRFIVWQNGLGSKIQAGTFELSPAMSASKIAETMTQGTNDTWVTVLEGWRVEEIADMLAQSGLPEFNKQEFLDLAKSHEGQLFPDTYLIPKESDAKGIVELLQSTFDKKVTKGLSKEIAASDHKMPEALVMASIVQREAREAEQMKIVAGILWNRIDLNMGLNADATLQYAKGYDPVQKTWWSQPTAADKDSKSPFNTYKNAGLPPHPICNPGLDAIRAAVQPTKTDYLYYLHDARGGLHYAKTLDGHNANVQEFLR